MDCLYCLGVDYPHNKIYVANAISKTVSMIYGNNDTVKKTIPVGLSPSFIVVTHSSGSSACCKIYVASDISKTVSVIYGNNDTVKKTIPVGLSPSFILYNCLPDFRNEIYVAGEDGVSVIDVNTDTVKKHITLPPPFTPMAMYIDHSNTIPGRYTLMVIPDNTIQNASGIELPIVGNGTVPY